MKIWEGPEDSNYRMGSATDRVQYRVSKWYVSWFHRMTPWSIQMLTISASTAGIGFFTRQRGSFFHPFDGGARSKARLNS